ncbi:MAG: DNA polymerase I [Aggregatilineales bacterium]
MSESRPRLVIVDGHAVAHRNYHGGQRALATSSGEPTSATFGFARTLLDLLRADPPPQYLAVAFDQGLSGRESVLPTYKSQRPDMEPALASQLGRIRQLVEAFNIPILEYAGCEADDVIGTVTHQANAQGIAVHIVTGDQDLFQLVNDLTTLELPDRSGGNVRYDAAAVYAKLGVHPEQVPDYKGLVGDSSDNIPGVKGIGEKTAVPLLQTYGTLEGIYANLAAIPEKIRAKLIEGRESAFLSRQVATIHTDLPIALDLTRCVAQDYDRGRILALFRELEFNSLIRRLQALAPLKREEAQLTLFGAPQSPKPTSGLEDDLGLVPAESTFTLHLVDTPEALQALVERLKKVQWLAFDTETDSLDANTAALVGLSLAMSAEDGYYIPVGHAPELAERQLPLQSVLTALAPALTDPNILKAAHNAPFDLNVLARYGVSVQPLGYDTQLAEALLQPERRHSLKDSVRLRFGVRMTRIEELIGKGKAQVTMDRVSVEQVAPYAAADAVFTFRLIEPTRRDLQAANLWALYERIELPLAPIIAQMSAHGALIDLLYLQALGAEFTARLAEIERHIHELAGMPFNLGSLKQLNDILFGRLQLPTKGLRKSQHGYSLDADALEALRDQHPIIPLLMEWRALEKLHSTYVVALARQADANGRVHTTYRQLGAVTGRLSSENPNLQNIPIRTEEGRRVRRAFIAPEGWQLLSTDYSQIELRILAHYSGDQALQQAFRDELDIHRATAALVSNVPYDQVTKEQRYFAKRVNFGLLYGMGAQRLARESELNRAEAEQFIQNYFARLPGVRRYLDESKVRAKEQGYLETLLGRRRDFSALRNEQLPAVERARIEREAINMPIQGTAADIMKLATVNLYQALREGGFRARLILQVHDELVLEVPEDELARLVPLVRTTMESAYQLSVPLRAEVNIGANWAEMEAADDWLARH